MKFLYLIQGKAENVVKYLHLNTADSVLYGLSYDRLQEGFLFLPGSSFAEGRNQLYQAALQRLAEFDYFVFIDDDVEFEQGSFGRMERHLQRYRPSIGVPLTAKTRCSAIGVQWQGKILPFVKRQRLHVNDEQYMACSKEVIAAGKILPYLQDWDKQSWFVCCLIQEALIQHYYFDSSLQFNDCSIRNDQHSGDYPHNLEYAAKTYRAFMDEHFPLAKRPAEYRTLLDLDRGWQTLATGLLTSFTALLRRTRLYRHVMRH